MLPKFSMKLFEYLSTSKYGPKYSSYVNSKYWLFMSPEGSMSIFPTAFSVFSKMITFEGIDWENNGVRAIICRVLIDSHRNCIEENNTMLTSILTPNEVDKTTYTTNRELTSPLLALESNN